MLRGYAMVEVKWRVSLTRFMVCSLFSSVDNDWMVNLRPGEALREKWRIVGCEGRGV
jgi:hypothetical protein